LAKIELSECFFIIIITIIVITIIIVVTVFVFIIVITIIIVQVAEIAVLLGLMCKYSCEECRLIVYGLEGMRLVELEKGTILNNMQSVLSLSSVSWWISWHNLLISYLSHIETLMSC